MMLASSAPPSSLLVALHVLTGVVYPLARHRHRAGRLFPARPTASLIVEGRPGRAARRSSASRSPPPGTSGAGPRRRPPRAVQRRRRPPGSNLGPDEPGAAATPCSDRIAALRAADPATTRPDPGRPGDRRPASGLDPDISRAAALVPGAARREGARPGRRGASARSSQAHTAGRTLGLPRRAAGERAAAQPRAGRRGPRASAVRPRGV